MNEQQMMDAGYSFLGYTNGMSREEYAKIEAAWSLYGCRTVARYRNEIVMAVDEAKIFFTSSF